MGQVEPWTEALVWRWHRDFRFSEGRIPFLRELAERDLLDSWKLNDDSVGALVANETCEFYVEDDSATVTCAEGRLPSLVWELLPAVERHFPSQGTLGITVARQYVIPLTDNYDDARRAAGAHLWPRFSEIGGTDFAFLFDGNLGGIDYHYELGVVKAAELRPRLTRVAGKAVFQGARSMASESRLANPPAVAMFSDIHWRLSRPVLDERGSSVPSQALVDQTFIEEQGLVSGVLHSLGVDTDSDVREDVQT